MRNSILSSLSLIIWAVTSPSSLTAQTSFSPFYSLESVTNGASSAPNRFSPNSVVTIYGSQLSTGTWAVSAGDIRGGSLPVEAPGSGVSVVLNQVLLPLFYVSPNQINALIPASVQPQTLSSIFVKRGIVNGPVIRIQIDDESPELFRIGEKQVAATHADGSTVTAGNPARAGEVIVIYGTGFGATTNRELSYIIPSIPSSLVKTALTRIRINDSVLGPGAILYVGVTPGFAGLYQANIRLPDPLPSNPVIQIGIDSNWSGPGTVLPTP